MNYTAPAPPKPQYKEFKSLHHMVVRRLLPLMNASRALEIEMLASDSFCDMMPMHGEASSMANCTMMDFSHAFERRSINANMWVSLSKFPLPSQHQVGMMKRLSARFPITTITVYAALAYVLIQILALAIMTRRSKRQLSPPVVEWHNLRISYHLSFKVDWKSFWSFWCISLTFVFGLYTWQLASFMAKDAFIDMCMTHKVRNVHTKSLQSISCRDAILTFPFR